MTEPETVPTGRILVVDDEEGLRTTVSPFLRADGNEVETAADYKEVITAFEANTFDLVMTDIVLPGKSGVEILAHVREQDPDCPVVLITGEPSLETATEAVRFGAFDYLAKPVRREQVIHAARQALAYRSILLQNRWLERENKEHRENLEERVEQQTSEIRTLAEIGRVVNSELDLDTVYETTADALAALIPYERMVISLISHEQAPDTETRVFVRGEAVSASGIGTMRRSRDSRVPRRADGSILYGSSADLPHPDPEMEAAGLESWAEVVLGEPESPIGIISVRSTEINAYSEADVDLLNRISLQISPAVRNARLFAETERSSDERAALAEISRVINSESEIEAVYEAVADHLAKLIPYNRLSLSIRSESDGAIEMVDVVGVPVLGYEVKGRNTRPDISTTYLANDTTTKDSSDPFTAAGLKAYMDVPMGDRERPIGYIALRSKKAGVYGQPELDLLRRFGAQISGAIANAKLNEQLRREADERATLAEIGRLLSTPNLDPVYSQLADLIVALIPCDRIVLSTVDMNLGLGTDRYVGGMNIPGSAAGRTYPMSESPHAGITNWVEPRILSGDEHREYARQNPDWQDRLDAGLLSVLGCALVWEDQLVGLLTLRSKSEDAFGPREGDLLARIANQIAGAVANATLNESLEQQAAQQVSLAEIGRIITSSPDIDEVYGQVAECVRRVIQHDRLVVYLFSPDDPSVMRHTYTWGRDIPGYEPGSHLLRSGYSHAIRDSRVPFVVDKHLIAHKPEWEPAELASGSVGLRSIMIAPLVWGDQAIGAMGFRSEIADVYGTSELEIAGRIAGQIAGAIANAQLHEQALREARERSALAEIGRVVNSNLDVDAIYTTVADTLGPLVSYDRLSISSLMEDGRQERVFVRGIEMEGEGKGTAPYEVKRRPDGSVFFNSASQFPPEDPLISVGLQSWAEVPLSTIDFPVGYLSVRSMRADAYTEHDIELMKQISGQISPAIENARLMAELEMRAHTDMVTGLPNRSAFETLLDSRLGIGKETAAAIVAVQIDRLRELENRFGVEFADSLLRAITDRLVNDFSNEFAVGRIGQDELGICIFGRDGAMRWTETASDIVAACTRPFEIEGELIGLDVALGVALSPGHARSGENLTRKAILAARSGNKTNESTTLFALEMEESASDHVRILTAVRQGMENKEVLLHYQPKVDLATGDVVGAEALARWESADRGLVSPAEFIPVLEDSGHMWEFTGWTIAEAAEQIQQWSDSSILADKGSFRLAVNVSARDFQDPRLPERIKANVELWGIRPELLEIEVTETAMMQAPEAAVQVCQELKDMGVSVAIDDFGVGQSPLVYLDRLDVDIIKIDRAFVKNVDQSDASRSIVGAIIGLGTQLGKKVVAEGVETAAEFRVLKELGCHQGQGYFWSKPMPEAGFRQLLTSGLES